MNPRIIALLCVFACCIFSPLSSLGSDTETIPDPFINPAGDLSEYDSINYMKDNILDLQIPQGDALKTIQLRGEIWYLRIYDTDDLKGLRDRLNDYIKSIEGRLQGDVTPEGDAFFLLPPGLWQL